MDRRTSLRFLGIAGSSVLAAVLAACAAPSVDDGESGSASAVSAKAFDRNNVLDDKSMRDTATVTTADVQKFLEKTPWGTRSALATYTEGGKTAAEIMVEVATAQGINPLELLVRAQMEQGLISKTTATSATIGKAFGCGCPDGSSCSSKYQGFTAQAECAAGTLNRSIDKALTSSGTVSGWARSKAKATVDGITITPANATTAALYTYTPYVGQAGGGKAGVGGVSLHAQVWNRFAEFTSYGAWATQTTEDPTSDVDAGKGTTDEPTETDAGKPTEPAADASTPIDPPSEPDAGPTTPDAGPTTTPDAGPTTEADAGTTTPPSTEGPPSDGSEDGAILSEGSAPPASNAPPSSTKKTSTHPEELEQASDDDLLSKKKAGAGCSTSSTPGGQGSSGVALAFVVAAAMVAARRRRGV
ncbi:MAG: hypothetical protein JWP97_1329 [Labilithrix sp.]|nr:hypothetical protein [Labilithrix sp.]